MSEKPLNNPNLVEVGKETRFRVGHSGNPHGRAPEKVIKEFLECNDLQRLRTLAEEAYKSAVGEDVEEVTEQELPDGKIIRKTRRWREKSIVAFKELLNRGYGLPRQEVEVSGNIGTAIADLFIVKNVTPITPVIDVEHTGNT